VQRPAEALLRIAALRLAAELVGTGRGNARVCHGRVSRRPSPCRRAAQSRPACPVEPDEKRINGMLARLGRRVSAAPLGEGHITLLRQARLAGGYIASNALDEAAVIRELTAAAMSRPEANAAEIERAIADGIAHGKGQPLAFTAAPGLMGGVSMSRTREGVDEFSAYTEEETGRGWRKLRRSLNGYEFLVYGPKTNDYIMAINASGVNLQLNLMSDRLELQDGRAISDYELAAILNRLQDYGMKDVGRMRNAIMEAALRNKYHPVKGLSRCATVGRRMSLR
jgi:hypothetical protein